MLKRFPYLITIIVRLDAPAHNHLAVRTDEPRIGVRDVATRSRGNSHALPARFGGREAANVGVDPVAYGAEGIVICSKGCQFFDVGQECARV